eukprot:2336093-Amphidinium_carterae.1
MRRRPTLPCWFRGDGDEAQMCPRSAEKFCHCVLAGHKLWRGSSILELESVHECLSFLLGVSCRAVLKVRHPLAWRTDQWNSECFGIRSVTFQTDVH